MLLSSNGLGRYPFKIEDAGSSPVDSTSNVLFYVRIVIENYIKITFKVMNQILEI